MEKPYLLIVTGRPGAGKTTFAKTLGEALFMPVISRDQIKEGYVHTFGKKHSELPEDANAAVTGIFFDTLAMLTDRRVSVIAEAAFQHELWAARLEPLAEKARIHMLICRTDGQTALNRFVQRGLENPLREYFHGDKGVDMARKGIPLTVSAYEEPHLALPTLYVDTSGDYRPSLAELKTVILGTSVWPTDPET